MTTGVLARYHALVEGGTIEPDPAQLMAAEALDELGGALASWRPQRSGLAGLFTRDRGSVPRGLYIHGPVGRGKTMLMDLFHTSVVIEPRRRIHFHAFMAEAHDLIGEARKTVDGDPIPSVAAAIARRNRLLCFDEMHVTDIADAMILGRLFKGLFERQVVVVATSNVPPEGLYRNGLNRQLFLPFIDLLHQHMEVLELQAAKDFRLEKLAGERLYFSPADRAARLEMDRMWTRMTAGHTAEPRDLEVKGRKVHVPRAAMGAARFAFEDLCARPLGSLDFLAIAHAFHTVFIDDIPVLTPNRRDIARRFINLIDTLYDARVSLVASADAEPHALYAAGDGADLFQRTASRLIDMRSESYMSERAKRADTDGMAATPVSG